MKVKYVLPCLSEVTEKQIFEAKGFPRVTENISETFVNEPKWITNFLC